MAIVSKFVICSEDGVRDHNGHSRSNSDNLQDTKDIPRAESTHLETPKRRLSAMSDAVAEEAMIVAAQWAQLYAAACSDVLNSASRCIEIANDALATRGMSQNPDQHELSRANFAKLADQKEQEFIPSYKAFVDSCNSARETAAGFLAAQQVHDPDIVLIGVVPEEEHGIPGTAVHILRAIYGPTPAQFITGIQEANAAIQGDIYGFGEAGFQTKIYAPPAPAPSDERTCPWCAETIKAAAVICRFCGRDVVVQPNTIGPS